jgi:hypothetical protein
MLSNASTLSTSWKAVAVINGELLGDESKMKINLLTSLHCITEAWRQIAPTTIENWFRKWFFFRW